MDAKPKRRNPRIHILGESPVMKAMEKVVDLIDVEFVDTAVEADLIIAMSLREVESVYSRDRHFAIVAVDEVKGNMPENVTVLNAMSAVVECFNLISEISEGITDFEKVGDEDEAILEVPLLPDAKSILVIDDRSENIASAKKLLAGHNLVLAEGYEQAMDILGKEKFEIVLTDLYMPMSSRTLSKSAFKMGEEVPYGLLLMLEAARSGATHVAVVTDLNHHSDHFSAAFDHFSRSSLRIENAKVKMMQVYAKTEEGAKDWKVALDELLS